MKKSAKKLIFISKIKSDGSGVVEITEEQQLKLDSCIFEREYKLNPLSLSEKTYVASGFNTYVVKLKKHFPKS